MSGSASRAYRSELRDAQASQTRARVLDAAAQEFAARGYAGTTLAAIARGAGVSVETVKLQGAKHELLLAAWNRRLTGSDEPAGAPFLDDETRRAQALALSDEDLLASLVETAAGISAESVGLWQAFAGAARFDEHVRVAFEATLAMRRTEFGRLIELFDARGMIANDRPRDELAATLILLASAEGYQHLVAESGMSRAGYRQWLALAIERLVLGS